LFYFWFLIGPMKKILLAGTLAFDEVTTPFGHSGRMMGGSAAYLALAASFFRNHTGIVSVVGYDFGEELLDKFRRRGVDLSGVQRLEKHKSFYWKGYYYENMNRRDTLVTEVNALAYFSPRVPSDFREPDLVVLGNLHPGIQAEILNQFTATPRLVVLDTMNFWMDNARDALMQVIARVDLLMLNEEEARQLTGEYSLVTAARLIRNMGPRYVIIKRGEYGALLFHDEGFFSAPAMPLEHVWDPTGAGDTFAGGFIGHLSEYDKPGVEAIKNAMICGANLASFTVEDFGTKRLENLTKEEINRRLTDFIRLTRYGLQEKVLSGKTYE